MPKLGQGDKVALIFFVLLAVFIFIAVMSSKSSPTTQSSKATTRAEVSQPKEWVKVADLSGNADKSGDTFKLTGGKVRVTYKYEGAEYAVGAIYIIPEGEESAQYVTMISGPSSDSTIVRKEAGDYYLKATAYEANYQITVEEER